MDSGPNRTIFLSWITHSLGTKRSTLSIIFLQDCQVGDSKRKDRKGESGLRAGPSTIHPNQQPTSNPSHLQSRKIPISLVTKQMELSLRYKRCRFLIRTRLSELLLLSDVDPTWQSGSHMESINAAHIPCQNVPCSQTAGRDAVVSGGYACH